ncbi:6-phosphogluconate dehydrogenase NAD-binding protein [Flagellimonas lutaonensis]|uniref:6-phosphogluconate dehydrogenase NAD-binding protein n=1 Tax=Flagellimonas lutaonensis TaxID=516051 RepID=A0A0D5YTR3_9FLAO|nr:6-phosphogluconate dehydrogenase NAD-binding protein [Allomuricauda lutaonensis]
MGCGWLGLPLASALQKDGHSVKGTTTSPAKLDMLTKQSIDAHVVQLNQERADGTLAAFLEGLDTLVVNVPPGLRKGNSGNYMKKIRQLVAPVERSAIRQLLFVSSTSVYGSASGEITEDTQPLPITESGKQLLAVEKLLFSTKSFKTTVVRFGGLIGPDRHPVHFLSGKKNLQNGHETVNLIHLEDCIHMIRTIIEEGYWGEIFNGVYPHHPTKAQYYTNEAKNRGLIPPLYEPEFSEKTKKSIINKNFLIKGHRLYTSIAS